MHRPHASYHPSTQVPRLTLLMTRLASAPLIRLRHLLPIAVRLRQGEGYFEGSSRTTVNWVAFSPREGRRCPSRNQRRMRGCHSPNSGVHAIPPLDMTAGILPFCILFAVVFAVCYGGAAWWTGRYASLPSWDFAFEQQVPFVPALSLVY